jgi:hypothetical protein
LGVGFWEGDFSEFGGVGEVVEIFEAKVLHEELGGLVEEGAAGDFGAASDADEVAVEEGLHDAIDGDAADGFDVGAGDGLAVGDDGEGFHGRGAEAGLAVLGEELAEPGGEVRLGDELPAGSAFADFVGAAGLGVFLLELLDGVLELRGFDFGEAGDGGILLRGVGGPFEEGRKFLGGDRFLGGEEDGFDDAVEGEGGLGCGGGLGGIGRIEGFGDFRGVGDFFAHEKRGWESVTRSIQISPKCPS